MQSWKYYSKRKLREVSKCGVFSGPYFPVFIPNTEKYGPGKTPYLDTFHAVGKLHPRKRMDKKGKNDDFIYKYQLKKTCGMFKSSLKFSVVILIISPYSVRMWENTDQNNSKYGHFLRSDCEL